MTQEGKEDISVGDETITMGLPEGSHDAIQSAYCSVVWRILRSGERFVLPVGPDSSFFTGKILWIDGGTFKLIRS